MGSKFRRWLEASPYRLWTASVAAFVVPSCISLWLLYAERWLAYVGFVCLVWLFALRRFVLDRKKDDE